MEGRRREGGGGRERKGAKGEWKGGREERRERERECGRGNVNKGGC